MQNKTQNQARIAKQQALKDMHSAKINTSYLQKEYDICLFLDIEKPDFRKFNGCIIL